MPAFRNPIQHGPNGLPCDSRKRRRSSAFTLVELLVVISILLILSTLTLALFNSSSESDRIRSSARQLQSALLGARDRAIKSGVPRGLRLILQDPANPLASPAKVVTSMVYIGPAEHWRQGSIQVGRPDFSVGGQLPSAHNEISSFNDIAETSNQTIVRGYGTDWALLFQQGLIDNTSRIEIPAGTGEWYTIDTQFLPNGPPGLPMGRTEEYLVLQGTRFREPSDTNKYSPTNINSQDMLKADQFQVGKYRLELKPTVLPGQEPMRLSSGIVIDLDRSQVPGSWSTYLPLMMPPYTNRIYFDSSQTVPNNLDIMFTPRGWVADGEVAASGLIHFYLCTQEDADLNEGVIGTTAYTNATSNGLRNASDPKSGEKLILTIFPQTGNIATAPVDITDANLDGLADDPFLNAKIGGTAGR